MDVAGINRKFPGRLRQIVASTIACFTALSDGMQYGWSSPMVPLLLSPSSPVQLQESDVSWLENVYLLGGLAGLPLVMYLLDKIGRKKTLLVAIVLNLIGWVCIAAATSIEVLYVGRFVAGMAADTNFVTCPLYIAELSDEKIRGRLGSLIYIMMLVGIVLIYAVGPYLSIVESSSIGIGILVVQLLAFFFLPDSPYYLLVREKRDESRKSLQFFRNSEDVEDELNELCEVIEMENERRGRPLDLLTVKSNRKAITIMTILNAGQHFSGLSVLLMNMELILDDAASIIIPSLAATIFAIVMLVACFLGGIVMDKFGRRVLLYTSSFLTGLSLLILAAYFIVKSAGTNVSSYHWVPLAMVIIYALVYKYGLGLVPIVLTAELFPSNVKAVGCAFGDGVYILAGALSVYLFHLLRGKFGMQAPFLLFAVSCMLVTIFSLFYIPETKGKTLDEIQRVLKGDVIVPHEKLLGKGENTLSYGTNLDRSHHSSTQNLLE